MKRVFLALAAVALIASANVASAKTQQATQPKARDGFVQRNVALPSQSGYHANGDLRYGPQIDYPQSPAGGGY
jgi:hypothetical protein